MAGLFDDTQNQEIEFPGTESTVSNNLFDDTQAMNDSNQPNSDDSDFVPGVQRGLQGLQSTLYGAGALAGEGLKNLGAEDVGQSLKDFGIEGYRRNVEEAKQSPAKHSFKDIYTGNVGDGGIVDTVGGAIDWAQGTLGELVPSMAEAAAGSAIGAAIGSTVPVAGTGAGAIAGAFATRTVLKKGIDALVKKGLKEGIGDLTEAQLRKTITKQALKKFGSKVGLGAAVMPMEAGGTYASLLEEHGVDAPGTALLAGALKTSIEFIGGNSKLVDTFVDTLSKGAGAATKKSAKEILLNIPQEALQEGGQELIDILNTVANTDEKLLTVDNLESIIESAAAGAVGGGAGSVVQAATNTGSTVEEQLAGEAVNITPTEGQKTSGNYKKGSVKFDGLDIAIENPSGTTRKGTDAEGNEWASEMSSHYGYFKRTEGKDGDPVDVFIKPGSRTSPTVFVVDQVDPKTGEFDEHKIILGAKTDEEAQELYLANYDEGWQGLGNVTPMGQNEFKLWLKDSRGTKEPLARTQEEKQTDFDDLFAAKEGVKDARDSFNAIDPVDFTPTDPAFEKTRKSLSQEENQAIYNDLFAATKGAKSAKRSFEAIPPTDELLTKKSQPYKNRKVLEKRIDARPYPENYGIVEVDGGFVGFKKSDVSKESSDLLDNATPLESGAETSAFTDEQQVGTTLQFQEAENQEALDNQDPAQQGAKTKTTLHDTLIQVKQDGGLTGQLAEFMSQFIPESKFDIPVTIDPTARSASHHRVKGITLRDPSMLKSSLHEIVHAVTVRELGANKDIRDRVISLMGIVEREATRAAHLTPTQIKDIKSAGGSKAFKNRFPRGSEISGVEHLAYALLNEKEFLSQAFSSVQVQEFMRSIKTTRTERGKFMTLWDDFIALIMNSLGIDKTHKTVFGEALKLTAELAQANTENTNQFDSTEVSFEELDAAEQKIPQAEYNQINAQKNDLLKNIAQQGRMKFSEVKLLADKALGAISTRLKNVDPELSEHLRWLDFKTSQKVIDTLKTAKPLLDATKDMSPQDKSDWNWARLNSDEGKIEQIAQKYNLSEDQAALREKLNNIRQEAKEVGYDVGFIEEYWPRVIKDQEGFLQATQEISQRPVFTEAIRAQAKKLGLTQEQFEREFPEVKADIISNLILGNPSGIGGPGNIQSRVFETIDKKYAPFYMDADAALMQYVYSMTKKIEARKFFGKVPKRISGLKTAKKQKQANVIKHTQLADMARAENPEAATMHEGHVEGFQDDIAIIDEKLDTYKLQNDYTENIGSYIDRMIESGRIQKKDEKVVQDILEARFNEHGTTGIVNAYKNLSYIDTMGSPVSAITQIGDLAWAMYVGKAWTPKGFTDTAKNLSKAIFNKSGVTKEDLGIERIAQEFADGTTLSKGVSKVFKAVGLEKIDSIGKEVLINNALDQFKAQAKANPEALAKQIRPTFGNKSAEVVQEILSDNPSENVKMLLYSKLLDFQPVALSEMPEFYLNSGNGRVFYMLKTYTLKQMDVFRREVFQNLKSADPQQKIQGMKNMVQLMSLLTLANAGADEIKDFMLGKETRFSDNVIENFLTMGGASRYTRMQVSKEGIGSATAQQILPPMKFINSASKDIAEGYKNHVTGDTSNFDNARIIDSIPGLGKLYYWHMGRGEKNKKSLAENDFKKTAKDTRLFKKQLENSDDKRLFIESNLDRFKQMKLQDNFQAALSRNKAVINKLDKLPSTENVQTRLGQLKQQREQILKRYFEASESLQ